MEGRRRRPRTGMMMQREKKENAMIKGLFQVWESIGGSAIDFRAADEREEEKREVAPAKVEEEEEEAQMDVVSEDFKLCYSSLLKFLGNTTDVIMGDSMEQVLKLQIKMFSELLLHISKEGPILSTSGRDLKLPSCYVEILRMLELLSQQAKE
eukprot:321192-Hanusia_phi.AAC.1